MAHGDPALAGLSLVVRPAGLRPRLAAGPRRGTARSGDWRKGLAAVLANRASWPGFFANLGMGGAFLGFAGLWGVPYLVEVHGMTRVHAANHASLMVASFACGGFLWGALSDGLRLRRPVFVLGAGLFALGWIPFLAGMSGPRRRAISCASRSGSAPQGSRSAGPARRRSTCRSTRAWPPRSSTPAASSVRRSCSRSSAGSSTGIAPPPHRPRTPRRMAARTVGNPRLLALRLASALFVRETRAQNIRPR